MKERQTEVRHYPTTLEVAVCSVMQSIT